MEGLGRWCLTVRGHLRCALSNALKIFCAKDVFPRHVRCEECPKVGRETTERSPYDILPRGRVATSVGKLFDDSDPPRNFGGCERD